MKMQGLRNKFYTLYTFVVQKDDLVGVLNEKRCKRELPEWETFNAIFLGNMNEEIRGILKAIYESSMTYGDYFKSINKLMK